ncbi:MAG TPA: kynureninase [Alphaproteobacteria bacterium]|nr:kynureninase [Alphaproteobacteria bacterium]
MSRLTRADCATLDARDPLAAARDEFELPEGVVYLDGNSLGALPRATRARLAEVISSEWGRDLIRSWNIHRWIDLPRRLGDKIARLVGAGEGEVVVADSTSVNLFKTLAAALRLNPGRRVIVSEGENFPTDLYVAQGLASFLEQGHELRLVDGAAIEQAIDTDTAVVMLTQVNYRTGALFDIDAITRAAQEAGALMLWDLAHSAGAMPVALDAAQADFAVGCGYKYLNGGPGAPAFLFVAKRHQEKFVQPLSGWLGHAAPFAFEPSYRPADDVARYLCGTPAILSMAALETGIDILLRHDMGQVRAKSVALGELFIALVAQECDGAALALASPRAADRRGSQLSFRHADGYAVMQALIARGVIGDFRAPDILRFGFAPLYVRHVDIWDAVAALKDVLATRAWDRPEFKLRAAVT